MASSALRARSGSWMSALSVISSSRHPGAVWCCSSALRDLRGASLVEQVPRREVHRDVHVGSPLGLVLERRVEHAQGERVDDVGELGQRNEARGRQHAQAWMIPSRERFEPAQRARRQSLTRGWKCTTISRLRTASVSSDEQDQPLVRVRVERGVVEHVALVALLRRVHRHVGAAHEAARVVGVVGRQRDAHARAQLEAESVDLDGRHRRRMGARSRDARLCRASSRRGARRRTRRRPGARPRPPVKALHLAIEPLRDAREQPVAHLVPQRVVHFLEAIQVDEQQRAVRAVRRRGAARSSSSRWRMRRRLGRPVSESWCARCCTARNCCWRSSSALARDAKMRKQVLGEFGIFQPAAETVPRECRTVFRREPTNGAPTYDSMPSVPRA